MKEEKSAGFILFITENNKPKFLILQYENYFDFPRGNIEKGETELLAAKRELAEETGIEKIKVYPLFKETITWFYRKNKETIKKTVSYFLAESEEKDVKLSFEHKGYAWVTYEEAMKLLKFENSKKVLEKAIKFIESIDL
ncbi:MAG: NUDIX domain-containing protein [Candidatus Aenigmatarchaeota archaeon]